MNEVLPQGPRSETKEQEGPQGGIPHVAGHTPMRGPKKAPIHPCHPQDLLEQSPKRWLSIK